MVSKEPVARSDTNKEPSGKNPRALLFVSGVGCKVYGVGLAARVLRVVLLTANVPQIRLEGLLAVRIILLCKEVSLVGVDIHQVLFASLDSSSDSCEASACPELIAVRCCVPCVTVCCKGVHPLTVGIGGRCHSVYGNQVIAVVVSVLFFRSFHGAADGLDTRCAYFH